MRRASRGGAPARGLMSLELDCAPEARDARAADEEVRAYARRYGCRARLLKRRGPGGGNPLWEFTGSEGDLRRLCAAHVAGHEAATSGRLSPGERGEVEFFMESAQLSGDVDG